MKNLTPIIISLIAAVMLQACGSGSKKSQPPVAPVVVVAPTEPIAVHHIQPDAVAEYVENFKTQQAEIKLQIEGAKYDIELIDIYPSESVILTRYEHGYVLIGFNFDEGEPVNFLRIVDSSLPSFEEAQDNPDRVLDGTDFTISEESDNAVFTGSITDVATQGIYTIRLAFNESLIDGGSSVIEVSGNKATVNGDLGTKTYIQVANLIDNHPEVKTLVLQEISGSINDAINMHTGRLIRNAQLTTMVEATSDVNSGGVDLYSSGAQRIYTVGAKLGVHSWCCTDGKAADELGRDHAGHAEQLTYFREMLGVELGPEFYFFTIEASPFDSVHVMTKEEVDKYLLIP